MKLKIIIAAIAFMFATTAKADFFDGNMLYNACFQRGDAFSGGLCHGYIIGTADMINLIQTATKGGKICIDQKLTIGQVADAVASYLYDHPEFRDQSANGIVGATLTENFACIK